MVEYVLQTRCFNYLFNASPEIGLAVGVVVMIVVLRRMEGVEGEGSGKDGGCGESKNGIAR